jgi:nucleoside-diphosphate-sugar epimerase
MTNCAITGASGYVGSRLCAYLSKAGFNVYGLSRKIAPEAAGHLDFELGRPIAPEQFQERQITVLIHAAYDFRARTWPEIFEKNIRSAEQLFDAARRGGVKQIIYISSQSAFPGCRSLYGKAKFETERVASHYQAFIVRPGLVYGPKPGGMAGSLLNSIATQRVLPVIDHPGETLRLIHEDDLCEMVRRLIAEPGPFPDKPIVAASRTGWSLKGIVKQFARKMQKRILLVPIPWQAVWFILWLFEKMGLVLSFRSDSVLTLGYPNPNPESDAVRFSQFPIREFTEAL